MSLAPPRSLHFKIHLGKGTHAHSRGGSWDKLTGKDKKGDGLREDTDGENSPFIQDLNFPKAQLSLWACPCPFPQALFVSINFFTLFFTFCLLDWIRSWLGRKRLGTLALIAVSCGPVARTPGLGNQDLASSCRSLLHPRPKSVLLWVWER